MNCHILSHSLTPSFYPSVWLEETRSLSRSSAAVAQGLRSNHQPRRDLLASRSPLSAESHAKSSLSVLTRHHYSCNYQLRFRPQHQGITGRFSAVLCDEDPAWAAAVSANTEHAVTYSAATRRISEARSPGARGTHRLVVPCLEGLVRFVQPFRTDAFSDQAALSALDEDCASRTLRPGPAPVSSAG